MEGIDFTIMCTRLREVGLLEYLTSRTVYGSKLNVVGTFERLFFESVLTFLKRKKTDKNAAIYKNLPSF